ncbi:MAG: flagellar protein FlaG [Gammaproteobacteria bacterium]
MNFNGVSVPETDPKQGSPVSAPGKADGRTEQEVKIKEAAPAEAADQFNRDELEEAVRRVSEFATNLQRTLQFRVDDITGRQVVTVIDSETEQVIRQIPSEEMLTLSQRLEQLRQEGSSLLLNALV